MDELRDRIIREATAMFIAEGVRTVRMEDIATHCGISKRTLYETFIDRETLVRECMLSHLNHHKQSFEGCTIPARNVLDEFWRVFNEGEKFRAGNIRIAQDLYKFYPAIFEEFFEHFRENFMSNTIRKFQQGIDEGLILAGLDVEFAARIFSTYTFGINRQFLGSVLSDPTTVADNQSMRFAIALFLRGIATERGRKFMDEELLHLN